MLETIHDVLAELSLQAITAVATPREATGNLLNQQTFKQWQAGADGLKFLHFRRKSAEFPAVFCEYRANSTRDVAHQEEKWEFRKHPAGQSLQPSRSNPIRCEDLNIPVPELGRLGRAMWHCRATQMCNNRA